ncbi:MAG: type II toxin-antitoxin system RelE/ParE family toxin [Bacteroidota bacterium]|nr:type II toxin-antitoxin system RelE/ParE family toxin [Bacteroidota bacterium]
MKYSVTISRSAEKDFNRLPSQTQRLVTQNILSLEDFPRPIGIKKLRGREEYRLRVGDYRILYTIDDLNKIIDIVVIRHRKDVYR